VVTASERREAALSVIVLTLDEQTNLPGCLDSVATLGADLYVVDSGSTDATLEIASGRRAQIFQHPFQNYAAQRNWALDHLPIRTPWILCLDADERLTPELADEIDRVLAEDDPRFAGYMLRRRTVFMGRWLRYGGQYPAYHLRLFRAGKGRCEQRLYDQHFIVQGAVGALRHDYIDILTDSLSKWVERHNRWASLEAEELSRGMPDADAVPAKWTGSPIERRRFLRMSLYNRLPLFIRPFLLWFFDYVIRLGFLDRVPGLLFYTLQRFWFRFLIDAKLYELRRLSRDRTPGSQ
jgi:glycosyltransferase involved in cell wall biosynthesis